MIKKQMIAEEVFLLWKGEAKEVGKARYTATERVEQLDLLCEMLKKFGIDLEDAKFLKKKVVEFVVTREGMKGNGKHKGWKEAAGEDFISNLMSYYQGDFKTNEIIKKIKKGDSQYYGGLDYMERTSLMVAWTKHKYKDKWTESICLEAHKIGSPLWQLFDKEVISSKWAKSGERPIWAKNIY